MGLIPKDYSRKKFLAEQVQNPFLFLFFSLQTEIAIKRVNLEGEVGTHDEGICNLLAAHKMCLSCSNYFAFITNEKEAQGSVAHGEFKLPPTHTIHAHISCAVAHYIQQKVIHTRTIHQDSSKILQNRAGTHSGGGGEGENPQTPPAPFCLQKCKLVFSLMFIFLNTPMSRCC